MGVEPNGGQDNQVDTLPGNQGLSVSSVEPCGSLCKPEKPYRGGGPALTDLLGGQVQLYFGTTASSIEYVRTGKLRPLGVTSATRAAVLPDVPALAEFLPGYEVSIYVGIAAPRNTPGEIIQRLSEEIRLALSDPKITSRIAELGDTPLALSTSEFAKLVVEETEKWSRVIHAANIRAE
jgi:tripartite-type tricarboxylate transporter receptor subunit TctC